MTESKSSTYRSVLLSPIPVDSEEGKYLTDPLWCRDININASTVSGLSLVCPIRKVDASRLGQLDGSIKVFSDDTKFSRLEELVQSADVLEIPGNISWRRAGLARRLLRAAHKRGKPVIVGISSNRPKTMVMNSKNKPILSRLRARLNSIDTQLTNTYFVKNCQGVRIIGKGLMPMVEKHATNIHIGVASWILKQEFDTTRRRQGNPKRVVIASRLEPMKGVAIGIEAVAKAVAAGGDISLKVLGVGAEEEQLRNKATDLGIADQVEFLGQISYPQAFHRILKSTDYVLLTNLNDEQPRLIFDAISQGAVPICPLNHAYDDLELDPRIFYTQGSPDALFERLLELTSYSEETLESIRHNLSDVAQSRTIETMHSRRKDWILSQILGQ